MRLKNLVTAVYFRDLFLRGTPFLDVRAEDEFAKGNFPRSTNHPILNNHERHLVGTCYKQKGQQAAVALGHQLVCGELKTARVQSWCELLAANPDTHVYCWRGGMRSNLARQWMHEAGMDIPLVEGGYKALRQSLIQVIDEVAANVRMIRVGGKTGVAKSRLINQVLHSVDLEKHANHRGSSFGKMISQQPTQSNFEHALAIDLLHTMGQTSQWKTLFVEDESRNIGAVSIPLLFFDAMRQSQLVLIEMPYEFRVQQILQEYVVEMLRSFEENYAESGFELFSNYLKESLRGIQKRLGLERYKSIAGLLTDALKTHLNTGRIQGHEAWIMRLLTDYYDPMYEYQISKKKDLIIFRGNNSEALDWALQLDS
ncbi:MAG: tRNA 2-selenouridine(34) synthase MnmH [Nitrosomonas sp.]|nr:tRNA 2-selenouridine(34) synthase MnmH [Nitrosomonas sp.]MDP1950590.1 tRNA 2-selenouridine(34) synthase MnmH [Nitrosomonas sp.]